MSKRNLKIRVLHFNDGITQLGGRMSISYGVVSGGPHPVDLIERIPGGYFVQYQGRYFVVGEAKVAVAEVEDLDETAVRESERAKLETVLMPVENAPPSQETTVHAPTMPLPSGILVDARGVYSRATTEPAAGPSDEPSDQATSTYKPTKRRQGPTP